MLFANRDEVAAILRDSQPEPPEMAVALLARGVRCVVLTLGAEGCLIADERGCRHVPAVACTPRDVTGAGDALIAGMLYRLLAGESIERAAATGTLLAAMTVESDATVLPTLTAASLDRADTKELTCAR